MSQSDDKGKAILPISYFGPVSYFSLFLSHRVVLESHENYQKRSVRNRTQILCANGVQTLSVPLQRGKTTLPITEVLVSYAEPWQVQHLKSIRSAYGSSPFFEHYMPRIHEVITRKHDRLYDLNMSTISLVSGLLDLSLPATSVNYSTDGSEYALDGRVSLEVLPYTETAYNQVFEERFGFIADLSILDLLFNLGPEAIAIL